MTCKRRRVLRPCFDSLDDRCLLSAAAGVPAGLSPALVKAAYGLNAISFSANGQPISGDGTGQTIAIVVAYHDPNLAADLQTFDSAYQLPGATLTQDNLAGGQTNDGWAQEESLDVEWAHAIAPGAKIVVVEAQSASTTDLMAAVSAARSLPGVSVVSMSWGGAETTSQTAYDSLFTTPAGHQGITFIAASGDSGSMAGAQWPASSPNVLSVGGTTLSINSSGTNLGESAWYGSGGGYSLVEPEPAYQRGVQSTGSRSTPDVSFVGDPSTGVSVFSTAPSTGQAGWQTVGGTSVGAPSWAGIMAIVDQGLASAGKGSLDGATQTLPALYSLPTSDFHAVSAPASGYQFGGFYFGPFGFGIILIGNPAGQASTVTTSGLGTPNGSSLVNDLVLGVTQSAGGQAGAGSTGTGGNTTGGGSTGSGQTGGTTQTPPANPIAPAPPTAGPGAGTTQPRHGHARVHARGHRGGPSQGRRIGSQATARPAQAVTTAGALSTGSPVAIIGIPAADAAGTVGPTSSRGPGQSNGRS